MPADSTSVVVMLARGIYAYRHRRWRKLVDTHMSEAGLGAGGRRGQVDSAEDHLDD